MSRGTVIYLGYIEAEGKKVELAGMNLRIVHPKLSQEEYIQIIEEAKTDVIVLVDGERMTLGRVDAILQQYNLKSVERKVGYEAGGEQKLWLGSIQNSWSTDREIIASPILIGQKDFFLRVYGGYDLAGNTLASVAYSLQKIRGVQFRRLSGTETRKESPQVYSKWKLWSNYSLQIPARYLFSGDFFRQLLVEKGRVQRDLVFRLLFLFFACFTFVFMAYVSKDYGIIGDEFMDHRHSDLVLDYFSKGDKAALDQPKTVLHLYGNCVQIITGAICRWFDVDNYMEVRHCVGGLVGALGILLTGLIGLRWCGGLGGLITLLLMFFTPRFFGHSMNNLKDIPFAVGYVMALYYTIRLFDQYPRFYVRHIIGVVLGIALAMGTRSGGLILYPMLFMYAGLYYIQCYGIKEFYKFGKYRRAVGNIITVLLIVLVGSYILSILSWPFALQKPISNVLYSLEKFTNYSIGLRTIFDGQQMMSNMLPWSYAPKYLCIGMPIVTLIGFFGYFLYAVIYRKDFTLISFFLLFATIFPVFWVIYKNSNLYGGIRHLLFVMPPMVAIAGCFWCKILQAGKHYVKLVLMLVFLGLFFLPVIHMVKNHPNDYVYFNEFRGGLKKAYGDYETDYYFNSLKMSADWFKKNVLPKLPKNQKITIVTQAQDAVAYYFRKDTNVRVIYSRYYEKYAKDWDYAIFGNVYVSSFQLKNNLFPPEGTLYAPSVDGYPMSVVMKRPAKQDLEAFDLERQKKYEEALQVFEQYVARHKTNEEVWSRMGKLYYITKQYPQAKAALENALKLHPTLNEALYIMALVNVEQKDYNAAFGAVEKILAENEFSADGWYLRATIYYQQRQYQKAINDLNRLLSFRPDFDKAQVLAGDIFKDNGEYQQAAKIYEKALKIKASVNTLVQLADVQVRMNNFKEAEELLNKAVEVQPTYYPIYKVKLRMSLMQGDLPVAGEYVQSLGGIQDDPELYVLGAMYYQQRNDKSLMKSMLDRALVLDPKHVEALKLKNAMK